tara:strand:+ start:1851 stop:2093 length:243 start_codon:yes stop_codon:yes gene_type:complete
MKLISRILANQAIGIKEGKAFTLKGKHTSRFLSEVSSTCRLNEIESGEIWIGSNRSVTFSKEIPEEKQQQFRNTINNSGS